MPIDKGEYVYKDVFGKHQLTKYRQIRREQNVNKESRVAHENTQLDGLMQPVIDSIKSVAHDIVFSSGYLAGHFERAEYRNGSLRFRSQLGPAYEFEVFASLTPNVYTVGEDFNPKYNDDKRYNDGIEAEYKEITKSSARPIFIIYDPNTQKATQVEMGFFGFPIAPVRRPLRELGLPGEEEPISGPHYVVQFKTGEHKMTRYASTDVEEIIGHLMRIFAFWELLGKDRDDIVKRTKKMPAVKLLGWDVQ